MAIQIKLRCSECETVRDVELGAEEKEIVCPVCGRRMANMPKEDHAEIVAAQGKQRTFSIVALVLFVIGVICIGAWMGDSGGWVSGKTLTDDGAQVDATEIVDKAVPFFVACVLFLASLVVGIMGSMKRFVVEF